MCLALAEANRERHGTSVPHVIVLRCAVGLCFANCQLLITNGWFSSTSAADAMKNEHWPLAAMKNWFVFNNLCGKAAKTAIFKERVKTDVSYGLLPIASGLLRVLRGEKALGSVLLAASSQELVTDLGSRTVQKIFPESATKM